METVTLSPSSNRVPSCPPVANRSGKAAENCPASGGNALAPSAEAGNNSALPTRFSSASYYGYSSESFTLKYQSGDGDTLEITSKRESFEMVSWQGKSASPFDDLPQGGDDAEDLKAVETQENSKDKWSKLHEVMQQVKKEMQQQQISLLKTLFGWDAEAADSMQGLWAKLIAAQQSGQNGTGNDDKDQQDQVLTGGFSLKMTVEEFHLKMEIQGVEEGGNASPLSNGDYWSAENTSERIVNFAMQFAGLSGEEDDGFAAKIKDAIELGFAQAMAVTGPLPGAAGKLTHDTHQLTFEKLAERLEQWKATPYNPGAPTGEASAPTEWPAGARIDLAA